MKLTDDLDNDSRLGQDGSKNGLSASGDAKLHKRRLIKIDSSLLTEDTDDDEEVEDIKDETVTTDGNPWQRTGSLVLSEAEIQHYCDTTLECRPTSPNLSKSQQCCIL